MKWKTAHIFTAYIIFIFIGFIADNINTSGSYCLKASPDLVRKVDEHQYVPKEQIHIEILNANGFTGVAARARKFLVDNGYEIIEIGNHDKICFNSMVYDHRGNINISKNVAEALGINKSFVFIKKDSSRDLHCTVILGLDYKDLKPFEDMKP